MARQPRFSVAVMASRTTILPEKAALVVGRETQKEVSSMHRFAASRSADLGRIYGKHLTFNDIQFPMVWHTGCTIKTDAVELCPHGG